MNGTYRMPGSLPTMDTNDTEIKQISVRIPVPLLARVRATFYRERLASRNATVCELLERGLQAAVPDPLTVPVPPVLLDRIDAYRLRAQADHDSTVAKLIEIGLAVVERHQRQTEERPIWTEERDE